MLYIYLGFSFFSRSKSPSVFNQQKNKSPSARLLLFAWSSGCFFSWRTKFEVQSSSSSCLASGPSIRSPSSSNPKFFRATRPSTPLASADSQRSKATITNLKFRKALMLLLLYFISGLNRTVMLPLCRTLISFTFVQQRYGKRTATT